MNLRETSIYIIGVGGTGSHLATILAKYFAYAETVPRRLILVDDDVVEARNAERQQYNRLDAGKYKVDVLKRRLSAQSGLGYIEALPLKFDRESMKEDFGLMSKHEASIIVFICVDNAAARSAIWAELVGPFDSIKRQYLVEQPPYRGNFVILDAGNSEYSGQVTTMMKFSLGEFHTLLGHDPRILFENVRNANPEVLACNVRQEQEPQSVMANIQAANMLFNEFVSIVKDNSFYPLVKFDLTTRQMMPIGQKVSLREAYQQWANNLENNTTNEGETK